MSRQVGQYKFDFHPNNPKISTGNDLKHVANVSGRGADIFKAYSSQYFRKKYLVKLYLNPPYSLICFYLLLENVLKHEFKPKYA